MNNNVDTIVSLFIDSAMGELLKENETLNNMQPKQQMLLKAMCKSVIAQASELSGHIHTDTKNTNSSL